LVAIGYALFLQGWWVPVATPILALNTAAIACFAYYSYTMQRLAYMDELTQVANRRYFDLCLAGHVQRKGNLSLILCDVDCFKRYNDTYGHQAGDECLAEVGRNLRDATRRTDFVARYGGEEFVVILPNTNAREASIVAERVVSQMRALQIPHESSTASSYVTLSCGVAHVMIDEHLLKSSDWSGATLIAQADKALYVSKENGRDRFTLVTSNSVKDFDYYQKEKV
jgi:diguanylate cyclase (GGDEF)-like protein